MKRDNGLFNFEQKLTVPKQMLNANALRLYTHTRKYYLHKRERKYALAVHGR